MSVGNSFFQPEKFSVKLATKFKAMTSVILVRWYTKFVVKTTAETYINLSVLLSSRKVKETLSIFEDTHSLAYLVYYHPTSGLMQILRYDWLRY